MKFIADTHLHVYPGHDAGRLLAAAADALAAAAPGHERILFLAERRECRFFDALRSEGPERRLPGWSVSRPAVESVLNLAHPRHGSLRLVAGRQLATSERLEVLALGLVEAPDEGRPAEESVRAVLRSGGAPVLAWAPGKWFFSRGRVVRGLIDTFAPGELMLGDSSLRPTFWPEPALFRRGRRRGLSVVAGSDPLPPPGEERWAGCYAMAGETALEDEDPALAALAALKRPDGRLAAVGRRCGPRETWRRLAAHRSGGGRAA